MEKFFGVGLILWLTWFGSISVAADTDQLPITVFRSGFIDQCTAAAGGRFYETNLDSGQILVRGQLRTSPARSKMARPPTSFFRRTWSGWTIYRREI